MKCKTISSELWSAVPEMPFIMRVDVEDLVVDCQKQKSDPVR